MRERGVERFGPPGPLWWGCHFRLFCLPFRGYDGHELFSVLRFFEALLTKFVLTTEVFSVFSSTP